VIPRSPFDLDDEDDDVEAPYVASADDRALLAQEEYDEGFSSGYGSVPGPSRHVPLNAGSSSEAQNGQNEISDALDAADYAGGSMSANPATMGEPEGKEDQEVGISNRCN
jgi:hypothetical protein